MTGEKRQVAGRFVALARLLFFAALAFTLLMALLPHPPRVPLDSLGDKVEHMLAFATLSVLAAFAFPGASLWRIGERLSFLGALIEVMQAYPLLHRDCSIFDWLADTVAVAIALLVVMAFRRSARAAGKTRL